MTVRVDWAARAIPGVVAGWGTPANSAGHLSGGGRNELRYQDATNWRGQNLPHGLPEAGTNSPSGQSRHGQVIEMAGASEEIRTPDPRFVVWSRRQFRWMSRFSINGTAATIHRRSPTFIGQELGISPIG